tara:strand:- start:673 stop:1443 length:771 start_codon:yes stop_codon:yes gene_type:complete
MMIKLFIGTSETDDAWIESIYLYSLFKNTSEELDITFLRPSMFSDWKKNGWGTPFTNFRYAVPELCNFEGRAIYTDVDQLNFRDINDLWTTDLEGCAFGMVWDALTDNGLSWRATEYSRGWFCDSVLLIDCKKAQQYIDPIEEIANSSRNYKWRWIEGIGAPFKQKVDGIIKELDSRWNCFDGRNTSVRPKDLRKDLQPEIPLEDIWHLHFTTMSSQPWHPKYSPHAKGSYPREEIAEVLWDYAKKCKMIRNPSEF